MFAGATFLADQPELCIRRVARRCDFAFADRDDRVAVAARHRENFNAAQAIENDVSKCRLLNWRRDWPRRAPSQTEPTSDRVVAVVVRVLVVVLIVALAWPVHTSESNRELEIEEYAQTTTTTTTRATPINKVVDK